MSYGDVGFSSRGYDSSGNVANGAFYTKVMLWVMFAFVAAAFGMFAIGPMIPATMTLGLWFVVFIALLAAGFVRRPSKLFSNTFAIIIPLLLGTILYPSLAYYVSSGSADIIGLAASGTAVIFGGMAILGWVSHKSIEKLSTKLFFIVLGLIAVSLLNTLFFRLSIVALLISCVTVVIFALYTFIDIQRVRDRSGGDLPASYYSLNLFLNIYNIFVSLLNIFRLIR